MGSGQLGSVMIITWNFSVYCLSGGGVQVLKHDRQGNFSQEDGYNI